VTTPLDSELSTRQVSHVLWIWFEWVDSWCHISQTWQPMDMRLTPLEQQRLKF